jgi:hypothetical protein
VSITLTSKLPDGGLTRRREIAFSRFFVRPGGVPWLVKRPISRWWTTTACAAPETVFARRMAVEHDGAAILPSVFYHGRDDYRVLRFCFAMKDATLKEATDKLCRI